MVAILASCDGEGSLKQQTISGGFSVSEDEITFYPGGETVQVMLTSGEDWSVDKPDWITLKQGDKVIRDGDKAGSYNLQLRAECNVDPDHRDEKVIFSSGLNTQTITVSQDQAYLKVRNARKNSYLSGDLNKDSFLWMESEGVSGYNEPLKLEVEGNVWWRIEPDQEQDYYKISEQEGEGDGTIKIIPLSPNISDDSYDIKLSIVTPHENFNRELSITQDNLTFEFNHKEINVNELGEPKDGVDLSGLTLTSEVPWSYTEKGVTSDTDWQWTDMQNEGSYNSESPSAVSLGTLEISANENRDTITHAIEFTPDIDGVNFSSIKDVFSIKVKQDPFIFDINGRVEEACLFENADSLDNQKSFSVNASTDWAVKADHPDWIQILDGTSGTGGPGGKSSTLTVAPVGQNLSHDKDRVGYVELVNDKVGLSTTLKVSQDIFKFKPYQGNSMTFLTLPEKEDSEYKSFMMTVDGAWVVENNLDWLSFAKKSGPSSEGILYVKANSTNTKEDDRNGSFKVVSKRHKDMGEDVSFTVDVKQNGFRFDVETLPTFYNTWSPKGEKKSLKIISPTQWTVKSAKNCTVSLAKSDADSEVSIAVDLNKTGRDRQCKVIFYNKDVNNGKGKEIPVEFTQKKYDFDVTWPKDNDFSEWQNDSVVIIPALPVQETYSVPVKCSGDWTVSSSDTEVAEAKKVDNTNNTSFSIELTDNLSTSTTLPTAEISVSNADLGETKRIKIIQNAYVYSVTRSSPAPSFGPLETGKNNKKDAATYKCSGKITYKPDEDWIHVVDSLDNRIYVYVDKHTESASRDGKVVIHNENDVDEPVEITVTQSGYTFSINPTIETYSGISSNGITKTIKLTSSGAWEVKVSNENMLSASSASGISAVTNKEIEITVKKHTDTDNGRTGTVTFVSKDNSNRKHVVTFEQNAAPKPKE